MNRFENITKPLMWFMALLLTAFVAGCGDGASSPILGGGGAGNVPHGAGDTTKPRVTVTFPVNAASGVPANSKITATFSEAMDSTTITAAGTFTLAQSGVPGTVAVGPVTYTVGSSTADIKPSADLTSGSVYTATITTAAKDPAGNALAGISANPLVANNHVWTFTAGAVDLTSPTIISTTPASGVISVPTNATVNATFSKAMDSSTISSSTFTVAASGVPSLAGTYAYDVPSRVATFTPSLLLQTGTLYTATITTGARDLAGNALAAGATPNPWTFTTGNGLAPGAVPLGSASAFGIMATSAITCVPTCIINGDVSLAPGTSITGPPTVNGTIHVNDTVALQAENDLLAAYNKAKGLPPGTNISGGADLGALYPSGIPPGTYTSGSTMLVSTPLVLDAGGNANAVWVFQIGSSLTTTANVTLANGAQAKNVFWVPTASATIGSGTTFDGTIIAGVSTTAVTGSTINGRILAGAIGAGTIALQRGTTVNVPAP
jgi:Ice-binding-like/Bacterial Ig-like domain